MATLLETASLVMVPSGYEDGTLGSLVPTDASGDFAFIRGSNLSATRVNEDGVIEKGHENLLLQSNQFDTSPWTTYRATLTSGQQGHDSSNNAWLLQSSSSGILSQSVPNSGTQTFSIYAKSGTTDWIQIRFFGGSTTYANFDLNPSTTGSRVGNTSLVIDATTEDVGNGWYRCSFSINNATTYFRLQPMSGDNINPIGGENIYIQDAMLNQGLVAYPYIETTAAPEKGGILSDLPRVDYSSGRASLLLEPERTNLAPYSEYIEGLGLTDLTPTPNATISPEGLQNAYKVLTGTAGSEQIASVDNSTTGNVKTQSVYIKEDGGVQWIRLIQLRGGFSTSASCWFDIQNGIKGSKSEDGTTSVVDDATKIEDAGNGWYRLTLVCTDSTNNTTFDTRVRTAIADGSPTRVSNGSYFVWGYQMESDASYPTSYIPTYGTTQTRLAETATTSADTTGDWALYYEFDTTLLGFGGNYTSGTFIAGFRMYLEDIWWRYGNINLYFSNSGVNTIKILVRKTNENVVAFYNGSKYYSDLGLTSTSTGMKTIVLNGGAYRQMLLFPTALSDEACIELTTL